jgi:hypothetical protein
VLDHLETGVLAQPADLAERRAVEAVELAPLQRREPLALAGDGDPLDPVEPDGPADEGRPGAGIVRPALRHNALRTPLDEAKGARPVGEGMAEPLRLQGPQRLVVDGGVRAPEQRGQARVRVVEPEDEQLRPLGAHRIHGVPVPELVTREGAEPEVLQRGEHGRRVAEGARVEAKARAEPHAPLEPVLAARPGGGEARMGLPVGPLDQERLVDRDARRVDVRPGGVEPGELVVEGLAEKQR